MPVDIGNPDAMRPVAPTRAARFARSRFIVPMIVAAAALGVLVNEFSYRRTVEALRVGSALVESRIAAAGGFQSLMDAEADPSRGCLPVVRADDLFAPASAGIDVPKTVAFVSTRLDVFEGGGRPALLPTDQGVPATRAQAMTTDAPSCADHREGMLQVGDASFVERRTDDLRAAFRTNLVEAASQQRALRSSLEESLWSSRVAAAVLSLVGVLALGYYIVHIRRHDLERADRQQMLEGEVRHRTAEHRQLAGYLQTAREDEKAHLARELHDELGGVLTAAKLDLARLRRLAAADPVLLERIEQVGRRLGEGIALKRRIIEDLRPSSLDTLGLTVSLTNLCSDVSARLGIPIRTSLAEVSLPADAQLALYRLVQEALTNVSKYADASEVSVRLLATSGFVQVDIEDNGLGFDTSVLTSTTHGIAGMRFRIERLDGKLSVESRPGAGTRLAAVLPLAEAVA